VKVKDIARVVHEANRVYCQSIGDYSQETWLFAPLWQKESAEAGVLHIIDDPLSTPEEIHNHWVETKIKDGWTYGILKDPELKEHPCIVPYENLPEEQKTKDKLFGTIVREWIRHLDA
jgi:hypothetical protein